MSLFTDPYAQARPSRRRSIGRILLAVGVLLFAAIAVMPAPYVIERPGDATNVLGSNLGSPIIEVEGANYPTAGALNMLTVEQLGSPSATPTWFEILQAWIDPAQIIAPLDEVFPPDVSESQVDKQAYQMMDDSQQAAIAAAEKQLGYQVTTTITVGEVDADAPAFGKLKTNDVITEINGVAANSERVLRGQIQKSKGAPLNLVVLRGTPATKVALTVHSKLDTDGVYRIGFMPIDTYSYPVKVQFNLNGVGGPSAGMMFALSIIDKMTPGSLTGGKSIAGTGTIDIDGNVGPIGGIRQKMYAAIRGGSHVMLAPAENCDEVVGHIPDGLSVIKVSTLKQALSVLNKLKQGTSPSSLPQCTN